MFEIEDRKDGMKTPLKLKRGSLPPEKDADRFLESPRVPCCYNAWSEGFIQYSIIHQWKFGPLN
jgi:hypothetical protein